MTTLRDITGNDTNAVMYALLIAARTDEKQRGTLQDVLTEYSTRIFDTASALPTADQYPADSLAGVVALLMNAFDGEAIVRAGLSQPQIEAGRIPLLMSLLSQRGETDDA